MLAPLGAFRGWGLYCGGAWGIQTRSAASERRASARRASDARRAIALLWRWISKIERISRLCGSATIVSASSAAGSASSRPAAACRCATSASEKRSEEHTSELQSLMRISYAVFCLKKKNNTLTANQPRCQDSTQRNYTAEHDNTQ